MKFGGSDCDGDTHCAGNLVCVDRTNGLPLPVGFTLPAGVASAHDFCQYQA